MKALIRQVLAVIFMFTAFCQVRAQQAFLSITPPVLNRSVQVKVSEGESLVSGFVIEPSNANKVFLIRAVGYGLKQFGVENYMKQPVIQLYRGKEFLYESYDWGPFSPFKGQFEKVKNMEKLSGAFPLDPGDGNAVVTASLPEGTYTIVVKGSSAGMVLLEQYEIPSLAVSNRAPSSPTLSVEAIGLLHKFSIVSTDADADDLEYGFDWNDDGIIDEYSPKSRPSITTVISHEWSSVGKKTFGVVVRDSRGATSNFTRWSVEVTDGGRQE